MKIFPNKQRRAFTLIEMLVSLGCSSMLFAAIITAGVALQRNFAAVELYSNTEDDQLRVLDYIAMDCRRATAASVTNNQLTLTLPTYYDYTSSYAPFAPTLTSGALKYGTGSVSVTYAQNGSVFQRTVTYPNSATTTATQTSTIATNVSSFTVTPLDQGSTNGTVTCSIMFFPTFLRNTGNGTWRSGASAPANTTGADGDWYVIDTTAADATTVGNVYFRSSGTYSLLQNVKATQVYSSTFLRNASARQ